MYEAAYGVCARFTKLCLHLVKLWRASSWFFVAFVLDLRGFNILSCMPKLICCFYVPSLSVESMKSVIIFNFALIC